MGRKFFLKWQVHGDFLDAGVVAFAGAGVAAEVEDIAPLFLQQGHVALLGAGRPESGLAAAAGEGFLLAKV